MFLVYHFTHYFPNLWKSCIHKTDPEVNTQEPQDNLHSTSFPNLTQSEEKSLDAKREQVRYSTYSLQTA